MANKQTEQMMESKEIEFILEGIASSLFRIANSLDDIAESKKPENAIHRLFPWGDYRIATTVQNRRNWKKERPNTFSELLNIGRSSFFLANIRPTKAVGKVAISSLDVIFEENGLGKEWMAS